ncbi:MAG: sigma 54-interacting transcriptional regulator, partial [Blastocatellales bacterium]
MSGHVWPPRQFEVCKLEGLPDLIICSESIKKALEKIARMGGSDAPVLITGETGTGKELFARAVHLMSARHHQPFIPFNCAAISRELAESHLFGHRRGSFTGALTDNQGVIRAAEGGTLFLDEIGEMSPELQPKLLRFLQEGEIHPVGEARPIKAKVRVVAATNRDLAAEVATGRFRADLFYRLDILNIHLPPLRSDRERIKPLIAYYFDLYLRQAGRHELQFSAGAVEALYRYDWPGNVRELSSEMQRLVLYAADGEVIGASNSRLARKKLNMVDLGQRVSALERQPLRNGGKSVRSDGPGVK